MNGVSLEDALNIDGKNIYYNGKLIKQGDSKWVMFLKSYLH